MKTTVTHNWHLIDASTASLGRVATGITKLLMGKQKANYAPEVDMGDYVVVVNAKDTKLTGNKLLAKKYYRHSGYPGGFREETAGDLLRRKPEEVIIHAITKMLPKNKLRAVRLSRLKVYAGAEHPHTAQFEKDK